MQFTRKVALVGVVVALGCVAPAHAQTSATSPYYPESTLSMKINGKPRAGSIASLTVTGFNKQPEAAGDYPDTFRLDVYVHDRAVWPNCPRNYIDENNRIIDLPTKVKWIGGGMDVGGFGGPFTYTTKFRAPSYRKVLFCAYSRYAQDDAAMRAQSHTLRRKKPKGRR